MMKKYLTICLILLNSALIFGQKDTVQMKNNDQLIGTIEKMEKSILTFSTSYDDSDFKIKWGEVETIHSAREFIIATTDGDRVTTTINSVEGKEHTVVINHYGNEIEYSLDDIVFIEPIGKNFLARLTVDLDVGFTLTKANNYKQFTLNLNATYLATKWRANARYQNVITRQDGAADIERMDGNLGGEYYLPHDWFIQAKAIYLSNNEQLLDLRSTYQAGAGYFFIRDNSKFFSANAGLAYTSENFTSDDPNRNTTEGYVALGFDKYDIGDLSIQTNAAFYPSFTQSGRYRFDFNFDLKYDLPLDFYIRLGLDYNYDSEPVSDAANDDYVFTTSFGWEWN